MVTLNIEGMSCMHCVKAVTQALAAVPGVSGTPQVDLAAGQAKVDGAVSAEALIAAVKQAGYPAVLAP